MTTTRINHSECAHASTAAARTACRKSGDWMLWPVNNGHTTDCLDYAAMRAWDNDEGITDHKGARRVGLAYLDNAIVDCTCKGN